MTKHPRIFEDSESFINDFFRGFKGQTKINPIDYFNLFEEPPNFHDLLKRCVPLNPPQFLLLDGQSRAGKTWTAVGLLQRLLDQQLVDAVWSSGEDSSFVYADERTTVADGVRWVVKSIDSFLQTRRDQPRVRLTVFLDDFFGSTFLRSLASTEDGFELVKECLTLERDRNPILSGLKAHKNIEASLLMTSRSSIFSLAEIRLDLPLGTRLGRSGRAFFEDVEGSLVGVGVREWLDKCVISHDQFINKHKEFVLPAMTAFSTHFPFTEPYGSTIPNVLFGVDLRAIMEELKQDDHVTQAFHGSSVASAPDRLRRLLLVYIAPALVLPLPSVDRCLTGKEDPKSVREALSLQPEEQGDFALRVPNRYYLRAIQEELLETKSLVLFANALIGHAKRLKELQVRDCENHLHVLSRGLIERGLESIDETAKQQDDDANESAKKIRTALSETITALPGAKEESLLLWEAALISGSIESNDVAEVFDRIPEAPGLASAVGWGMYRFRRVLPPTNGRDSYALNKICGAFERMANTLGEDEDHRVLTVAYSNFIRWATQMVDSPTDQSPIGKLAQVATSTRIPPYAASSLRMVLEDALIWADSFQVGGGPCLSVSDLSSARDLWNALESDYAEPTVEIDRDASVIANRLFSLEWHNEWKERKGYRRDVLWKWLRKNQEFGLRGTEEKPELLDDNLSYHWSHMITQWSVWARDWCFSPNPNEHENKKELIGCADQKNNEGIRRILKQAIDSTFQFGNPNNRFRNSFFLLAIRSGGPASEDLREAHEYLSEAIGRASARVDDIKKDLVHAIYELIRQGYVDWTETKSNPRERDDRPYLLPKNLRLQCVDFLHHYGSSEWLLYLNELKSITCLDVLPQREDDLVPYGRVPMSLVEIVKT
jgi:hypothetical protein